MRPETQMGTTGAMPVRVPRWAYALVSVLALLLGATALVRQTRSLLSIEDSDLTNFFLKSADYILRGDPWHIYAARGSGFTSAYPNYNPPLSIFLMAPLLQLARAAHFAANNGEVITVVSLPFLVLVPLLGLAVVRTLRRHYPEISEAQRLLAFALVTLSPVTWQSITPWYHLEQPLMLCLLLLALWLLQSRRVALAGVVAGLAVLTRTTALMPLVALGVLLLLEGNWRSLLKFGGVGALVAGAGVLPFFIAYPRDTMYSLLTWRGGAPIGGNTLWTVFAYGGTTGIRHTLDAAARRLDSFAVLLFIIVVAALAARGLRITATGRDALAVLALAALAVPMLSKTAWPYYYLEPFIFLLLWEFASMHDRRAGLWRWPVLSLSFLAVAATLSQSIGLRSVGTFDRISLGLLQSGVMAGFALAIWVRAGARKAAPAPAPRVPYAPGASPPRPMPSPPQAPGVPRYAPGPVGTPHGPQAPTPLWPGEPAAPPRAAPPSASDPRRHGPQQWQPEPPGTPQAGSTSGEWGGPPRR